jgi:chemotaxis signal transduction protein
VGAAEVRETLTVLVCEVAGSLYGLPLTEIGRVTEFAHSAAAPAADPAFLGLVSAAGRVRPVLDLAGVLSSAAAAEPGGYLLVPRGEAQVAFRVVARPSVAEVQRLDGDAARATVTSRDEFEGRLLTLISIRDLTVQDPAGLAPGA